MAEIMASESVGNQIVEISTLRTALYVCSLSSLNQALLKMEDHTKHNYTIGKIRCAISNACIYFYQKLE
jgi:hypothetical protein